MTSSSVVWTNSRLPAATSRGRAGSRDEIGVRVRHPGRGARRHGRQTHWGRPAAILLRPGPRCAGERVPTAVTVWSTSSVGVRTHRVRLQLVCLGVNVSREGLPVGIGAMVFRRLQSLSECVLPATTRPPLCRRHPGARPAVGGIGLIRALLRIGKINTLIAARGPALSLHPAPMRRRPADDSCDILRLTAGTRRRTRMKRLLCGRPASASTPLIGRTTGACARGYSLMRNRQDACPLRVNPPSLNVSL